MTNFRDDLKARCAELPWGELDKLRGGAQAALMPVSRPAEFSPLAKLPRKFRNSIQAGLRRALELTEGLVTTFNAELFIPSFVQARVVLETGVGYVYSGLLRKTSVGSLPVA